MPAQTQIAMPAIRPGATVAGNGHSTMVPNP